MILYLKERRLSAITWASVPHSDGTGDKGAIVVVVVAVVVVGMSKRTLYRRTYCKRTL